MSFTLDKVLLPEFFLLFFLHFLKTSTCRTVFLGYDRMERNLRVLLVHRKGEILNYLAWQMSVYD